MRPANLVLALAALLCAGGASAQAIHIDCQPARSGPCIPPDAPAPPAPPAPPALPALPAPPAPPALPAPPAPPALPAIPAKAHAACAAKADGSTVTVNLGRDETMRGLCERVNGKMVFQLRSYRRG